ncbi:MAG: DNA polymerase I, partial [Alphaproteobacteria bacterium]|nr:DNA polymerase I [Alphaproteobacteria bacterium]
MLTLIDGNSLLFRAYYGVHGNLTRSDGMPIGAVYGFFNMLLPILADAKSNDSFVCIFDASRITFRQDIYPQYKANRIETPTDLLTQGELIRIGVRAMGIPVLCIPNVEADDVIATISKANCNNEGGTRIITGDKDLMQLVSHCVFLYDGMKQKEIHEHEVIEKFGVEPDKVIEVQSLMGDTSDNVPGVRGIGPKTATSLIQQFGTLENLYNNLDNVKNERIRNLLQEHKSDAFISKQLVTLKTDVNLDGLIIQPFVFNTPEALNFVIQKIESNSLYTKIQKLFPSTANIETPVMDYAKSVCPVIDIPESITKNKLNNINYHSIITEQQLKNFLADVKNIIAFDTETTGLNQIESKLVGISLAVDEQNGVYIPLRHKTKTMDLFGTESFVPGQLSIDTVFKYLSPIFVNNDITKVAHNLKYDLHILENEGFDTSVIQNFDDTMLLSYILHGTLH